MYGLVHIGLRHMITEHRGPSAWSRVCDKAGVDANEHLASSNTFPDEETFKLVSLGAHEFGISLNEFLEQFGFSWISFVGGGKYAPLLKACGNDLAQFLENVNTLHSSLGHVIPSAKTGHFLVKEQGDGWVLFRYAAARENLHYFLRGLIKGICDYLNLQCDITMIVQDPYMAEMLVKTRYKLAV